MFKKLLRLKAFPAILILAMMFILCITAYGTDTDGAVSLAENAVKIVTQPQNVTVDYGSTAEVSVDVSGDGLSYKWYLKDRGATKFTKSSVSTDTYSIVLESSKDGRQVYCVVTDKYGNSVTTDTVTLKTKAVIVTQPRSVTVEEGEMARVSVSVKGRGLSYEWYYKNKGDSSFSKTSSFTGSYYSAKMDSARDGRQLYCVITDANGNKVKTNTVSINMGKFAKIVTQPKSVTVSNGGKVNVTFKAAGDGLTYTWYYKDGASLKFAKTNTFKSNSYTTVMTPARAGRQIYCVVTDKYGNSVSTDVVTLNMVGAVKITKQPVNAVAPGGTAFAINVKAEGDGLTYTWYYKEKNSTVFRKTTTFTGPTYNTIMTDARNGRQVYCVITDKYGCSVVTDTVTVIMGNPTTIVKQPENVVVPGGSDFRITVKATGDGLTYTWYYKNKGESSFTKTTSYKGAEYFATMSSARNGRQVYCVITDKYGTSVKTDTVTLIMGNPATIVKQPESVTVPEGGNVKITVEAVGDGLTYAWYYKERTGASFRLTTAFTDNTYSVSMTEVRSGRQVYCVITDKYGTSVVTNTVKMVMGTPLSITKQPSSVTAMNGTVAETTVAAVGDGLKYQWYIKHVGKDKFEKSSLTSDTYSVTMSESVNGRQIYCVITDKYGFSVKTETVTLKIGAFIVKQPESVTVADGSIAETKVEAIGEGLTYQWYFKHPYKDKFYKSSITTDIYSVTMSSTVDERQVYCVITDANGNTVTTDVVTLYMEHSYDKGTVTKNVTCTEDGTIVYTCSVCGKKKTVTVLATGHDMGDWQVWREPTPENEGVERSSCANCSYYNDRSIAKIKALYYITVNDGVNDPYKIGVGSNGVYTLATPKKIGYNFLGWKDSKGNDFAGSGTVKSNVTVTALWELDGTDTLEKLIKRAEAGVDKILITADITVTQPIFISHNTTIYSDGDHTLLRAPNYTGDIFVVGQDKYGRDAILDHRVAVLTLGGGKGTLTIDGNRDNLTVKVVGSAVYVADSAILNLYDGVRIVNNLKLGNDRALRNTDYVSASSVEKAGGAAILMINATVNMYGGVIENNEVATEYNVITNEDGTTSWLTSHACGGAVYARGNFNMYGGVINNNVALRGGGVYSDYVANLYAGTISNNLAYAYGGGFSTSSSNVSDAFVGTEGDGEDMIFSGNVCKGPGGAMYSNTSSPIIIYGNAVFINNHSETSGGAIHTAGSLTVRGADFIGNTSVSSGGAIYHYYTKAEFERRHITLENCTFENNSSNLGGAVILSASNSVAGTGTYATITDCVFTGNDAVLKGTSTGSGGAIYITRNSEATITGCTFTENTSTGTGGALSIQSGSIVDLKDSTFKSNSAVSGGAVTVSASTLDTEDLLFDGNSATNNGGAMYVAKSTVSVKNLDFKNNSAATNGGAVYMQAVTLTFGSDSEFKGNSAGGHGGVFYLTYTTDSEGVRTGSVLTLNGNTFDSNTAMAGGAISVRSDCEAVLTDCTLTNNSVSGYSGSNEGDGEGGGAIYVGYGKLTLNNVTATGNTAYDFGGVVTSAGSDVSINGGVYTENKAYSGGVIFARNSTVNMIGVNARGNESVYENTDYNSDIGGGAVNVYNTTLNVTDTTFDGNKTGYYGGAILTSKSTVTISNTAFTGNSGGTGAAAHFKYNSNVTIKDSTVTGNESGNNGVLYQNGGTLDIDNVTASGNKANNGGVLYVSGASTVVNVKNSTWSGNTAGSGGVIYVTNATVNINGCTIKENTANTGGAIYNKYGTVKVTGTEFKNNSSVKTASGGAGSGGAIGIAGGVVELSDGTTFVGNVSENHGGAIHVSYATETDGTVKTGKLIANGILFENNGAIGGGAISIRTDCEATVESCTFDGNFVNGDDGKADGYGEGGGAIYAGYGTLTVTDSNFTKNTSTNYAGAVHILDAMATITNCDFTSNEAGSGGAVYAMSTGTVTITDCDFDSNSASVNAGALYIGESGTADLTNVSFTNNSAAGHAGALYINKAAATVTNVDMSNNTAGGNGGALYLVGCELNVDESCSFTSNTAGGHGGAIYLTYKKVDGVNVGAVLNAENVTFSGNTAMAGGAVSIRTACEANLNNCVLTNNSVTGYADDNDGDGEGGGAVYVGYGTVNMTNVTATGNSASDFGGVIDAVKGTVTINGGTFTENTANAGGVIYAITSSSVTVNGAAMKNNESVYENSDFNSDIGGGAIAMMGGTLDIKGSVLDGNKTKYYGGAILTSGVTVNIDENTEVINHEGATGAALYFKNGSKVTIANVTVKDNKSTGNGVIYQNGGTLDMTAVTASGNTANSGGVLFVSGGSTVVTIKESVWNENSAKQGGAIHITNATVTVENCEFNNNTSRLGGAVYNKLGTFNTVDTVYSGNKAENNGSGNGGAISIAGGTVNGTGDNSFIGNTAENHGGAIYVSYNTADDEAKTRTPGTLNMTGGSFEDNTAFAGGAISSRTDSVVTLTGTELKNNTATSPQADKYGGGAIYTNNNTLTLSGVTLDGNSSPYYGGAVFVESAVVTIKDDTVFKNNVTVTGVALYIKGTSNVTVNGASVTDNVWSAGTGNGVIYATGSGTLDITDLTASGNKATNGGVMYVSGSVNVTVSGSEFTGNSAAALGGVIDFRSTGTLTITDTVFKNNTAKNGGAVNVTGTGTVSVTGGSFEANTATANAGAIYATEGATVTAVGTDFIGNTASGGGAIYTHSATLTVTRVNMSENSATGNGGAIYAAGTVLEIGEESQFTMNTAVGHGGALYLTYVTADSGNVATELVANGATFSENTAMAGGAISIRSGCVADLTDCTLNNNSVVGYADENDGDGDGGGAIYVGYGKLTMTNVTATGNTAETFGGVVDAMGGTVNIIGGSYSGNEAVNGGVVYARSKSTVNVNGAEFTENKATSGGAIAADSNSTVNVVDSTFNGNESVYENTETDNSIGGGAIHVIEATLTVSGSTFNENGTGYYGGAIYANKSTVNITGDSVFYGNTGVTGAALYFRGGSEVTISDTTVVDNKSISNGVVYQNGGTLTMTNVTATGNEAARGGVLYVSGASTVVTADACEWTENSATSGGVIYMENATVTLKNGTVSSNTAIMGGAVYNRLGDLVIETMTFANNTATKDANSANGNGGAIMIAGGTLTATGTNTFSGNTAENHGGAIYGSYVTNTDGTYTGASINVTDTVFENNSAVGGGAISIRTDCAATVDGCTFTGNSVSGDDGKADGYGEGGGAIYAGYGTLTVTDSEFSNNSSSNLSGAIHVLETETSVSGSTFTENSAATGGAMYLMGNSNVGISDSTFTENTATANAGAIYATSTVTLDFANVTFNGNEAVGHAGAVYINDATVTALNVDMEENVAGSNGGAIYLYGTELNLDSDSTFTKNSAGGHGGAIYVVYKKVDNVNVGAVVNANGTTFSGNTAMAGGAISIRSACTVNLTDCILTDNSVTGYADENDGNGEGGGAVYVGYGTLNMTNVTATGNGAEYYGGVVDALGATVTVTGGEYTGNTANAGGVIYALGSSTVTVNGAIMNENVSVYDNVDFNSNLGGGAIATIGGKLNLIGAKFNGNVTDYYGGTILTSGTTVTISDNTVVSGSVGATGAALYFKGGSKVTITDSTISDNVSNGNGVVYQNGGTLTFDNVTASGNTAKQGGVLFVSGGSTVVTVNNSTWSGNSATTGGAVYMDKATVNIVNSEMKENSAATGGAVYNRDGSLVVDGATFTGNTATNGGAVALAGGSMTSANDNTFTGNTAETNGGAIYVTSYTPTGDNPTTTYGSLTMTNGTFDGNTAYVGGAIFVNTGCTATLTGTTLKNNVANCKQADGLGGGAIYAIGSTLDLSGVTLDGNSSAYYGGALYLNGATVNIKDDSVIKNNVAITGVAVYIKGSKPVNIDGVTLTDNVYKTGTGNGVLYATNSAAVTINNLTASSNKATNGGIMYVSGTVNVTVTDSEFTGNTAVANGGVFDFRSSGTLSISGTTFSGNTAKLGAVIYTTKGTVTVKGSTLTENTATEGGGAIYATEAANVTVSDDTTIELNTAPKGGAVFVDAGATVTINDSILDGNSSTGDGGAVYVADTTETGTAATTLNMSGTTLSGNTSGGKGGALSTDTVSPNLVINVNGCTFSGNSSTGAGGGAVEIQNQNCNSATDPTAVTIVFTDCTFSGNTAKTTGGAIEIRTNSCAKFDGITATDNKATENGGVIYVTSNLSRCYLTGDVTISGNTSKGGTFIHLYTTSTYTNPPKLYTTHSSSSDWCSQIGGNTTNVEYDLTVLP